MRLFYEIEKRLICVDAPQSRHREVLAREKAQDARWVPKYEALSAAKERKVDIEWYDLEGKF